MSHVAYSMNTLGRETPWREVTTNLRFDPGARLRAIGRVLNYAHDSEIYSEGEQAASFFKVISGVVRTCKFLEDGRRQIDCFYVAGDLFGLEASRAYSLCAEAVNDCALVSYRRLGLEGLATNDAALASRLFAHAMRSASRAQQHSLSLGCKSAAEKVAGFLMEMVDGATSVEPLALAMTRQDIADYLGVTMETVSRTLSQFERLGHIELRSARLVSISNPVALRRLNS